MLKIVADFVGFADFIQIQLTMMELTKKMEDRVLNNCFYNWLNTAANLKKHEFSIKEIFSTFLRNFTLKIGNSSGFTSSPPSIAPNIGLVYTV